MKPGDQITPERRQPNPKGSLRRLARRIACKLGLHARTGAKLAGVTIRADGLTGIYRCTECGQTYETNSPSDEAHRDDEANPST